MTRPTRHRWQRMSGDDPSGIIMSVGHSFRSSSRKARHLQSSWQ
jgi:hypothetical protein